ncbi:ABC transporter permease [Kineosporia succinea]|uniref:ABC transport system permease protein n=1 Tax=Kineosporia succinea TaxID=84632 RepID=A0ABT9PC65_9ACTN|nr:ABC transporter permease [Kineosporia succinea]MDP9830299.1 putative ABC transport system permease protein [Kineosporia succinea]
MSVPPELSPARLSLRDLLGLGLIGIRTRRLRAALSGLGISIGIATLVVVTTIPASSQAHLLARISALGTDMLQVTYDVNAEPKIVLPPSSVDMVSRIGPVSVASAVANLNRRVVRSEASGPIDDSGVTTLAARDDLLRAVNGRVRSGRFLSPSTSAFPTVVLGSEAAGRLGLDDLARIRPAPQIRIGDKDFTVIGILEPVPLFPDLDVSALIGWPAATEVFGFGGSPTIIYVKADESLLADVRAVLPATVNPQLPGVVRVSRPSDALAAKEATQQAYSGLFLGLAGVALLVGGIGVANTMYISVLERRREIGVRRALGASRGQVRAQFLTESAALSGLGGLAGTLIGCLASVAYCQAQGWPPVLSPPTLMAGLAGAVVIGMAAGAYPSVQASRLTPTAALAAP